MSLYTADDRWSLVIQRVGSTTAQLWFGTLFGELTKPSRARIRVFDEATGKLAREKLIKSWDRPFSTLETRFYRELKIDGLRAGKRYTVTAEQYLQEFADRGFYEGGWQLVARGEFNTLPGRLPEVGADPFTVALGSCYYADKDNGAIGAAYEALYSRGQTQWRPDVSFLTGDQVYLDVGGETLSPVEAEVATRLANVYAGNWRYLRELLRRGGTWMLADDHELWNGYPEVSKLNPLLWRLQNDAIRAVWEETALSGIHRVQSTKLVETFTIGQDLSFCLADFRSSRTADRLMPAASFRKVLDWARSLKTPGVLVTCQPLIVKKKSLEDNLRSYGKEYAELIGALGSSGHDIVLMSGDVHFGRIASTGLGPGGGKLYEVIASPMSNLTGSIYGLATNAPDKSIRDFPDKKTREALGWDAARVKYHRTVDTRPGHGPFSPYPKRRTREHFVTVSFHRLSSGGVRMQAQAWRVRSPGRSALPARDFRSTYTEVLT